MLDEPDSCLPHTALEEAALYHDAREDGYFALLWHESAPVASKLPRRSSQSRLKVQRCYPLREMPQIIENLDSTRDIWISQAEFVRPNRRIVYLLRLGLNFVDLDYYKTAWKGCTPEALVNHLLGFCQDEAIPEPSLILFSGQGLQVKWLLERPCQELSFPAGTAYQDTWESA